MKRREFIGAATGTVAAAAVPAMARTRAPGLRILILGGTRFIGVHMTELALKRGHEVTLFNRGKSNPALFPRVRHLQGDRNGELETLKGSSWDAVIDDSGYVPRHVRLSAELLAPHVQRYVFISSISAYASFAKPLDEDSPLAQLADSSIEKVTNDTYGPLKALCERAVETALPHRALILRPHIVVGPHDTTDRFTYWPARAARGGELLAPGVPGTHTQFIDARDLARFTLDGIERELTGTFNMVVPPGTFTIGDLVSESIAAAKALARPSSPPEATWVSGDFLEKRKVDPDELPLWYPPTGEGAAFAEVSAARAVAAGLTVTPLRVSVRDTLAWHLKRPASERTHLKAGLDAERESMLLKEWHAAGSAS